MWGQLISSIRDNIRGTKFENNTFLCGGFVRDKLLNRLNTVKDIDIVVTLKDGGIELCNYLYDKGILTTTPVIYNKFQTAMSTINNISVEFIQSRTEKYNGINRFPKISYGTLQEDCYRRDFTVNALYINIMNDEVYDYVNGIDDLKNNILRCVSDVS